MGQSMKTRAEAAARRAHEDLRHRQSGVLALPGVRAIALYNNNHHFPEYAWLQANELFQVRIKLAAIGIKVLERASYAGQTVVMIVAASAPQEINSIRSIHRAAVVASWRAIGRKARKRDQAPDWHRK